MSNTSTHDPIASIREHVEQLGVSHAWWESRGDNKYPAKARLAGSDAIQAIDAMLRELHQVCAQTITELRQWDDERDAAIDAYLASRRAEQ